MPNENFYPVKMYIEWDQWNSATSETENLDHAELGKIVGISELFDSGITNNTIVKKHIKDLIEEKEDLEYKVAHGEDSLDDQERLKEIRLELETLRIRRPQIKNACDRIDKRMKDAFNGVVTFQSFYSHINTFITKSKHDKRVLYRYAPQERVKWYI